MQLRAAVIALFLAIGAAPAARAQDFLFGQPLAQLTVRAGPVLHRAQGDVFDFFTRELTLDRGDFRAPALGGELTLIVQPRIDVTLGLAHSEMTSRSEFRHWVEEIEGQPDRAIEQSTRLRMTPLTASVRVYPTSRGETISRLAWLPARVTPYVGAGGGVTWYQLRQHGDFIDMRDLSIFTDDFESKGRGWTGHALAGVDYWVTPRFAFNFDARYSFGTATLELDYAEWKQLDLGGLQAGLGLTLRW